ncbi:MAG: hypothetical protein NT002_10075 [candidate division Zixibacteria bacterium]|nr:hypothetical protein [candidate division Zixibacteria bacterium]
MAKKLVKKVEKTRFEWPFGPKNYAIFGIGLLVIILGYISLASGSITLAPILLVLGYCVLIPVAIIIDGRRKETPADSLKDGISGS